jgi:hypothetical protein
MIVYVFLTRRPQDKQEWPCVYLSLDLAEKAPHRVSAVVPVEITATVVGEVQVCET